MTKHWVTISQFDECDDQERLAILLCSWNHADRALCRIDDPTPLQRWSGLAKLIAKIPHIAKGAWDRLTGNEVWFVYEALGNCEDRDDFLQCIYEGASERWNKPSWKSVN